MKCAACQAQNRDDRHFCRECGVSLDLVCTVCLGTNEYGSNYCGTCGTRLPEEPIRGATAFKLSADEVEHPEDIAAKARLRESRAVLSVMGSFLGDWEGDAGGAAAILRSTAPVTDEHAQLWPLFRSCLARLDVGEVELRLMESSAMHHETVKVAEVHYIIISSALLEVFDEFQIRFVLGHEFGHILCEHVPFLNMFRWLTNKQTDDLTQKDEALDILRGWCQCADLSADRSGFFCAGGVVKAREVILACGGVTGEDLGKNPVLVSRLVELDRFIDDCRGGRLRRRYHPYLNLDMEQLVEARNMGLDAAGHLVIRTANNLLLRVDQHGNVLFGILPGPYPGRKMSPEQHVKPRGKSRREKVPDDLVRAVMVDRSPLREEELDDRPEPVVEQGPAVEDEPAVESKPAIEGEPAIGSDPAREPVPVPPVEVTHQVDHEEDILVTEVIAGMEESDVRSGVAPGYEIDFKQSEEVDLVEELTGDRPQIRQAAAPVEEPATAIERAAAADLEHDEPAYPVGGPDRAVEPAVADVPADAGDEPESPLVRTWEPEQLESKQPAPVDAPVVDAPVVDAPVSVDAPTPVFTEDTVTPETAILSGEESDPVSGETALPAGFCYAVIDMGNHRFQLISRDGTFIRGFGNVGSLPGQFNSPKKACIIDDSVFITDFVNCRVQKFNLSGTFLCAFGKPGSEPGELSFPTGLSTDAQGNLLVLDAWNKRIQRYDIHGNYLSTFGDGGGAGLASLSTPGDMCRAPDGGIWVADTGNNRLQYFDTYGEPSRVVGEFGSDPGCYDAPGGLVCDEQGFIYISDTGNSRIQVLDPGGQLVLAFGELGEEPGKLDTPGGIAVDPDGNIVVADSWNYRIQVFSRDGSLLQVYGTRGVGPGEYEYPHDILIVPANLVEENTAP